jgi:hypothetical protein
MQRLARIVFGVGVAAAIAPGQGTVVVPSKANLAAPISQ